VNKKLVAFDTDIENKNSYVCYCFLWKWILKNVTHLLTQLYNGFLRNLFSILSPGCVNTVSGFLYVKCETYGYRFC